MGHLWKMIPTPQPKNIKGRSKSLGIREIRIKTITKQRWGSLRLKRNRNLHTAKCWGGSGHVKDPSPLNSGSERDCPSGGQLSDQGYVYPVTQLFCSWE